MPSNNKDDVVIIPKTARLRLKMSAPTVTATYAIESNHLIKLNEDILRRLIEKVSSGGKLSQNELIDSFISLHVFLEVGINTVLRKLALSKLKKPMDPYKAMDHLDNIGFIEKVSSLVYFENFEFGENIGEASKNVSIISQLKDFSKPRNKLLHGHAIVASGDAEGNKEGTPTAMLLDNELFIKQLALFTSIVSKFYFFLGKIHPVPTQIESYKQILDNDFIPPELVQKYL